MLHDEDQMETICAEALSNQNLGNQGIIQRTIENGIIGLFTGLIDQSINPGLLLLGRMIVRAMKESDCDDQISTPSPQAHVADFTSLLRLPARQTNMRLLFIWNNEELAAELTAVKCTSVLLSVSVMFCLF